jgi:hypothetical protein
MSATSQPYWDRILRHFEQRGYVWNGLTIPFLIGSRTILEPNEPLMSVEDFLYDASDYGVTILKCNYLGEFVIGSLDSETAGIKDSVYKTFDNIVITDSSLNDYDTLDELISHFKKLYDDKVISGNFSKERGYWDDFSTTDKKRIEELL